jgi:hypothetical protein
LQKHTLAKEIEKESTNDKSLNQAHCFWCEKGKITNIQYHIYMGQKT